MPVQRWLPVRNEFTEGFSLQQVGGSLSKRPPHIHDRHSGIQVHLVWDLSIDSIRTETGIEDDLVVSAAAEAASYAGFLSGQIGIRITDDEAIHTINRNHLGHDYPTDVISFPYRSDDSTIDGELIASLQTAKSNSLEYKTTTVNEILLYVIHGVLHIAGYDDQDEQSRKKMHRAEEDVLKRIGVDIEASQA